LVPEAGLDFIPVDAAGFDRAKPLTLLTSSLRCGASALRVARLFRKQRPDVVACFGGYVSIPVGLAARWSQIPLVLHEQNSVMGMTNRYLAKHAACVFLTYPNTEGMPKQLAKGAGGAGATRVLTTGNPVRPGVVEADSDAGRAAFGIGKDALLLLVFGGSRGARHINQAMLRVGPRLLQGIENLHIVHAAGPKEYDDVSRALSAALGDSQSAESKRYHLVPYLEQMGDVLAAADLALTRAGATSIAELTACGIPSVLVPYPFATDDHQTKNAAALTTLGGARLITDAQLDDSIFETTLVEVLSDAQVRATMAKQARALGKPQAAHEMADVIESFLT